MINSLWIVGRTRALPFAIILISLLFATVIQTACASQDEALVTYYRSLDAAGLDSSRASELEAQYVQDMDGANEHEAIRATHKYFSDLIPLQLELLENFRQIDPPEAVVVAHDRLESSVEVAIDAYGAAAEQLEQARTTFDLLQALEKLDSSLRPAIVACLELLRFATENSIEANLRCRSSEN